MTLVVVCRTVISWAGVAWWSGCTSASLATDTGVSAPGQWCTADKQDAHVGETVNFRLVVLQRGKAGTDPGPGVADYAVAHVLGERIEADLHVGRFEFGHTLSHAEAGTTIAVEADAYKIRGRKDYVNIKGSWHRMENPNDQRDERVAGDSLVMRIYQSIIDYSFDAPRIELDWSTARLVLTTCDNRVSTILTARHRRSGFAMEGTDRRGRYTIHFAPAADQINKTGRTAATLYVLDINGQQHTYSFDFATP